METIRVGVRTLVEFTLHGEDIRPTSLSAMAEGALGHKARQKLLPKPWQSEVPLSLTYPLPEDDLVLEISGRMDAFLDGNLPCIEEIKLFKGKEPPKEALPAHMAQAMCYAHMLLSAGERTSAEIRVVYVGTDGSLRGEFSRRVEPAECRCFFDSLVAPYAKRLRVIRKHTALRDEALKALPFPYESFRPGQREMAVQVYRAIQRKRRLFASMPTGTGKSAATLFPALKALGEGKTRRIYYLTARTTQRQGPLEAVARMREQPFPLWVLTLDAKDRQCPHRTACHPDFCPRAKGHFLRDSAAIEEMLETCDWSVKAIRAMADKYDLCPFEFSLSLAELADLTVCDYNYALDPAVHIRRIFDRDAGTTLLIDEAHHLPDRLRDMLSGEVDGGRIRRLRTVVGKVSGRKHPLYKAMTAVLNALEELAAEEEPREGRVDAFPEALVSACRELAGAFIDAQFEMFPWDLVGEKLSDTLSPLISFNNALESDREVACLWSGSPKSRRAFAFVPDVGSYFDSVTSKLPGVVCFSATMDPLPEMRTLLGCGEEDPCFSAPSSFPPENLLLLQKDIDLRWKHRDEAVPEVARQIEALVNVHPGHYLAFFPSFSYLTKVADALTVPFTAQSNRMTQEEREAFLALYTPDSPPVLGLCVLGGLFSEGIDLAGSALDGAVIVGVGLPQVNLFTETLRNWYEERLGEGFLYAYRIPGIQKAAQAAGRVIRSETDRGVVLLLDERFRQSAYRRLCPPHWQIRTGDTAALLREFWKD